MTKLVYIVGAGDLEGSELLIPDGAIVIAADGGLTHLKKAGISPDLIMGDFDSYGSVPEGKNVTQHKAEKNDTDTMLAVREALALGAEMIVIYGGLGGRFDHSIANLQALQYIAGYGASGYLVGYGCVCTVINNGGIAFNENMKGLISVFSLSESSTGVSLRGLKYPLTDYSLRSDYPLGVSNEFTGAPASVSVKNGTLALVWSGSCYCPNDYFKL